MIGPETRDELWKRHEFLDGLYRFYLDQIINFHNFYLPVVGALVVYVLAHPSAGMAFSLLIPIIASVGAAAIFGKGIGEAMELRNALADSAKTLIITTTHVQMLVRASVVFLVVHSLIVLGMGFLFVELNHGWNLLDIKT
jgi:hypothetical protein